ncbi:MAG TPA: hypothetical protein VJV79_03000 [Polyangiaceae bacterium]|nr:hypothetical protein [Polyangiaceae bacterium]
MTKKGEAVRGSSIDASAARAAFDNVQARLNAVPLDQLQPIRVDVQAAAAVAHGIAVRDGAPERRVVFERLSTAGLFEMHWLDSLAELSLATWHTRQQQQVSSGVSSGVTLPVNVIEEASALRSRMLRVLEYYFGDHPTIGPKLSVVRAGTGYQDLANDLEVTADLYEEPALKAILVRDPMHYQAEDPARARALASTIFGALGLGSEGQAKRLAESSQRAWTLLARAYDKLRLAGQYIFADQEDVAATYPSLVSIVRAPATRRPPSADATRS